MTIPLTQRCTWVRPGRVECKTRCPQNLLLPEGRVILWLSLSILTAYSIDESNSDRFRKLKLRGFPKAYTLCKLSNIRTQAQPKGSRRTGRTYEWVCGYAYLSGTHTNSSTFQENENKSAISWEGLKTQQYSSGVEYKATSHFDSPPNKPLRACVSKGCTLLPGLHPFSVHGHDRKYDRFVLQAFALFRTPPHFQFVSFHEDTDPYPRCNEPEYSANACSWVRN